MLPSNCWSLVQADALKENCASFGMPAPRLEGVDAIEEDLAATESSWELYKEYSSELKVTHEAKPSRRVTLWVVGFVSGGYIVVGAYCRHHCSFISLIRLKTYWYIMQIALKLMFVSVSYPL